MRRSAPWVDSAPSTAKATRSRSAAEAGPNNSVSVTAGSPAPRRMLTGRSRRFAKVTTCIIIAAGRTWPGVTRPRSLSPRKIRTAFLRGSAKVTTSAVSTFSATGFCPVLSCAGEPPRTILTGLHPVSGKVTNCTLPVLPSIACLRVSAVICALTFAAASALHAVHSAAPAQTNRIAQIPPRIAPSIGAGDQITPKPGVF